MLIERMYDVTLTFERVPEQLAAVVADHATSDVVIAHNTVHLRLREDESRVLDLVAALARHGRVLRVEINGASLEDIFVALTQRAGGAA